MNVQEAAKLYISRGWQIVPLKPKEKSCYGPNWKTIEFTPEDFKVGDNIGIKAIGGIVDIDLDCIETVLLGDHFLPKTEAIYGRKSKPKSHRLYTCKEIERPEAFLDGISDKKSCLLEIRVGHQSMAPPSIHPEGEEVAWEKNGKASEVKAEELVRSVRLLATVALVARYYPSSGLRHEWWMPFSGFLRSLEITEEECLKICKTSGTFADDDDIENRLECVRSTYSKTDEDALSGAKILTGFMPEKGKGFVASIRKIWGMLDGGGKDHRGFACGKNGQVLSNSLVNILLALKKMKIEAYEDTFANKIMVNDLPFADAQLDRILVELELRYNFQSSEQKVKRIIEDMGRRHPHHPVKDYLEALKWDCKKRIHEWLIIYANAPDTKFVRAIGKIVLIAAVRRVRQPGCKFDEMLILESGQGWNKSTALRALCPREEWFTEDVSLGISSKETIEQTAGCWIIEASELKGLQGRGQDKLKTFLSRQKDGPVRMAYAKLPIEVPRQFIVIGTTNSMTGYLRDITGNRRYWPVRVQQIDVDRLKGDRDQLWAEAAMLEKQGASIRLDPKLYDDAQLEQENRRGEDPWEGLLEEKYKNTERVRYTEVYDLLSIPSDRLTREMQTRLHSIMQRLGFTKNRSIKVEGKVSKGWVRFSAQDNFLKPVRETRGFEELDKETLERRVQSPKEEILRLRKEIEKIEGDESENLD